MVQLSRPSSILTQSALPRRVTLRFGEMWTHYEMLVFLWLMFVMLAYWIAGDESSRLKFEDDWQFMGAYPYRSDM